jgi:hypothetical protein
MDMAAKKPKAKPARKGTGTAAAYGSEIPAGDAPIFQDEPRPTTLSAVPRPLKKPAEPRKKPEPSPPAAPVQEPEESAAQAAEPESRSETPDERPPATPVVPEEKAAEPLEPLPLAGRGDTGSLMKGFAVLALLGAVIFLAYYFISLPENSFVPGAEVDADTFKGIFFDAPSVFIVMDVRGAGSDAISSNILQCGVDFAASSGMGGKSVTPISFGPDGCVAPDGEHPPKECFAMLKNGVTIYVKEGLGGAKYYSNGMVVSVGPDYSVGTCGIKTT